MGPILFSLYVNDLPSVLETVNMNMHADDTAIYIDGMNQEDVAKCLSDELAWVSKWCQNNCLVIQVKKSFAMFLSRRKQSTDPVMHLDGTTLETRPCADYLGVCIDNQLSWKEQVKKVTGRAYGALRNLRRVKHSLLLHTRKLLYRALVLPIIEYGSVVWDPSTAILKAKLERVQNYAACLILDKPPWTSSEEL